MRVLSSGLPLLLLVGLVGCDATELSRAPTSDAGPPLFCGPGTVQIGPECVVAGHGGCACPDGTACPDGDLSKCVASDAGSKVDAGPGDCKCADGNACPNGELSLCSEKTDGGSHVDAGTCTLQIRAWIEGDSQLEIRSNTVWWQNKVETAPGLATGPGLNTPTTLTTCKTTGNWCPVWSSSCDSCTTKSSPPCATGDLKSEEFTSLNPPIPLVQQEVKFKVNHVLCTDTEGHSVTCCRGKCGLIQEPKSENNYTTILDLDDSHESGAAWYDLTLEYKME